MHLRNTQILIQIFTICIRILPQTTSFLQYIGYMFLNGPFGFRWLNDILGTLFCYHHQLRCIHPSHCFNISRWLCASGGCAIIVSHLLHIYPGNIGILLPVLMCRLRCIQMIRYILACLWVVSDCMHIILSHYNLCANLSEGIEILACLSTICYRGCI